MPRASKTPKYSLQSFILAFYAKTSARPQGLSVFWPEHPPQGLSILPKTQLLPLGQRKEYLGEDTVKPRRLKIQHVLMLNIILYNAHSKKRDFLQSNVARRRGQGQTCVVLRVAYKNEP